MPTPIAKGRDRDIQIGFSLRLLSALSLIFVTTTTTFADPFICKKTSNGNIAIRTGHCRRGESKITNVSALTGPQGPAGINGTNGTNGVDGVNGTNGSNGTNGTNGTNGNDGADGSIRIYGNGSAGALTIGANTTFTATNTQYSSVTINSSRTLTVASGTIIRSTGTVTNNGTIRVLTFARGGFTDSVTATTIVPSYTPPSPGISSNPASQGEFGTDAADIRGGTLGSILSLNGIKHLLHPGLLGGGGGAGALGSIGGNGGGSLVIIAAGAITNNGLIEAIGTDGGDGSGGGGGGVVILASNTLVTNSVTGTIDVSGGDGGQSSVSSGAGGGGGGGIVDLLSPSAPIDDGTLNLVGGLAGSNTNPVTDTRRSGGASGGSSYGAGGAGSQVSSAGAGSPNTSSGNTDGGIGAVLEPVLDPTSLL